MQCSLILFASFEENSKKLEGADFMILSSDVSTVCIQEGMISLNTLSGIFVQNYEASMS